MRTVAIYNMKGGVGKTTTAVNLSYLAAAAGQRTLLWDLDPQAASSFAFRVRPRVSGFARKSLEDGEALGAAIKETDYYNLQLLPADFAYRKFDRFLDFLGKPERLMTSLLDTLGRDFDTVFLDCPPGFSRLTEGIFAAADAILVPTIPTVLSIRTVARLIKWGHRSGSRSTLAAFFNMVDRRRTLHRHACEWSGAYADVFLSAQVPYASVVEQMTVRRLPLPIFAADDAATSAFVEVWSAVQKRLEESGDERLGHGDRWPQMLEAIESLMTRLESADRPVPEKDTREEGATCFVHTFDTQRRDLERSGHVLELREREGILLIVAATSSGGVSDTTRRAHVHIDGSWALQILTGEMSPLAVIERRLGHAAPGVVESMRAIVGERPLRRIDTRAVHDDVRSRSIGEARPEPTTLLTPRAAAAVANNVCHSAPRRTGAFIGR